MSICIKSVVATCVIAGLASAASAQNLADEISVVKAANEKYRDVNVALAAGFVPILLAVVFRL